MENYDKDSEDWKEVARRLMKELDEKREIIELMRENKAYILSDAQRAKEELAMKKKVIAFIEASADETIRNFTIALKDNYAFEYEN